MRGVAICGFITITRDYGNVNSGAVAAAGAGAHTWLESTQVRPAPRAPRLPASGCLTARQLNRSPHRQTRAALDARTPGKHEPFSAAATIHARTRSLRNSNVYTNFESLILLLILLFFW